MIDAFFFDFDFFFFFKMIMSTSIEWSSKKILYNVVFDNFFDFEIKISLKIKTWKFYLLKHFDQHFVSKLFNIIKRNANVEYIENNKFFVFINHRLINEISNIFIVDFNKQRIVQRMSKMFFFFTLHLFIFVKRIFKKQIT